MTTDATMTSVGERFVAALVAKDERALRAILAPDVRFRGLTPDQEWASSGQQGMLDIVFGSWFEPSDQIEELVSHDVHAIMDKIAVRYRCRVRNPAGLFVVEEQGFLTLAGDAPAGGRIRDVAMICSGFRPL